MISNTRMILEFLLKTMTCVLSKTPKADLNNTFYFYNIIKIEKILNFLYNFK